MKSSFLLFSKLIFLILLVSIVYSTCKAYSKAKSYHRCKVSIIEQYQACICQHCINMRKVHLQQEPMMLVMPTLIGPATVFAISRDKVITIPMVADKAM